MAGQIQSYSINLFHLMNEEDETTRYYATKLHLDYFKELTWGKMKIASHFVHLKFLWLDLMKIYCFIFLAFVWSFNWNHSHVKHWQNEKNFLFWFLILEPTRSSNNFNDQLNVNFPLSPSLLLHVWILEPK